METSENTIAQPVQKNSIPTELTLGRGTDDERTYDTIPLLRERENSINGYDIITRAKNLGVHLGIEHQQYFINHQAEVPAELRDHIFLFTDCGNTDKKSAVGISDVYWNQKKGSWEPYWSYCGQSWGRRAHVLRPRKTFVAGRGIRLPSEITFAKGTKDERVYDVLSIVGEGEIQITGHEMMERARKRNAHLGRAHRLYILDHQKDIPKIFHGNAYFVFTDELNSNAPEYVAYLSGNSVRWLCGWGSLDSLWSGACFLRPRGASDNV